MQWPLRHICGNVVLAYLPQREIEMSSPPRPTDDERPRRAARGRSALGAGDRSDPRRLLIVSAIIWAIATAHGNHATASKGRTGVLVSLGAAVLAGAGVTWMNWLLNLGQQL